MPNDNLARLAPFSGDGQPSNAIAPIGRVVSVGGSQVMIEFSTGALSNGDSELTVGAFLGIWNGRTLVVGSLCDISLHKLADGQQSEPASGRVDLLGELILDQPGAGYFQRGVMTYPRIGSPIVPVGHDALLHHVRHGRAEHDQCRAAAAGRLDRRLHRRRRHGAASISRSSASTGAGKSSAVSVLLREIMDARQNLRILLDRPAQRVCRLLRGPRARRAARQPAPALLAVQLRRDAGDRVRPAQRRRGRGRAAGGADPARQERIRHAERRQSRRLSQPEQRGRRPLHRRHAGALPHERPGRDRRSAHGQAREQRGRRSVPAADLAPPVGAQEPALLLHLRRRRRRQRHHGRHPVRAVAARRATASR